MANKPVVANLDYQDIKTDIIEHFKAKPEFADYEFTGSSLNLLMEILAYNTHYNALTANLMMNEMFLDTANVRSSVTSIAKSLNYTPRSKRAAKTTIVLNVPRVSDEKLYIIPAGSVFTAKSGNVSALFYTIRDYFVQFDDTASKQITIEAYEGKLFSQRFAPRDNSNGYISFTIDDTKIDDSTLVVSVNGTRWKQITSDKEGITETDGNAEIYFIEETKEQTRSIVFGNGTIGKALSIGDEVIATYVSTNDVDGNGIKTFVPNIDGRADITIVSASLSQGGAAAESVSEIKRNAPHWFQSQYRAVTENDYEVLLKKKYADIQSIRVYGGETVGKPGKVFIAIRPKSSDKLTQSTKVTLINDIIGESNILTVTPEIVDPFYVDAIFKTVVTYNDDKLTTNVDTLKSKVASLYDVLNTTYLGNFETSLRESAIASEVIDLDESILSVNQRLQLQVELSTSLGLLDLYNFSFANKLYNPESGYKETQGGILSSSLFSIITDLDNQYGLDDDGKGNIRLYKWIDNSKEYTSDYIGKINYSEGNIDLSTTLRITDDTIKIRVIPDSFDVLSENNTILRIDTSRTLVEAIEYRNTALLKSLNVSRSA